MNSFSLNDERSSSSIELSQLALSPASQELSQEKHYDGGVKGVYEPDRYGMLSKQPKPLARAPDYVVEEFP